jgi:putative glutamine amidotransferase
VRKKALVVYRHGAAVAPYEAAVRLAGIEPVLASANAPVSLDGVSGLVLTGGEDVNPELYGEARIAETEMPDDERDAIEMRLIGESLERDLPLLAICRGLQILNVQHGGTLIQHVAPVERHRQRTPDRGLPVHQVNIAPNTLLASIAGTNTWDVNSRHHQAVATVGNGLVVSAIDAEDGTIEALERGDKRFVLAVQWHPEDQALVDPEQLKLFRRFADAL